MACERIQRLIGVYRELDRAERRMVNEHLRACSACQAAWQDELRVRAHVRSAPMLEPGRGFESRLLAIPRQMPVASPMTAWLRGIGLIAAAAVGAGLLVRLTGLPGWPSPAGEVPAQPAAVAPAADPVGLAPHAVAVDRQQPVNLTTPEAEPPAAPLVSPPRRQAARNLPKGDPNGGRPASPDALVPVVEPGNGAEDDEDKPEPPPNVCVSVAVTVFTDLAGDGDRGCPGCDGRWTDDDQKEADRLGLGLPPGMQALLVNAANDDDELIERPFNTSPALARDGMVLTYCDLPAGTPLRVKLLNVSEGWLFCPLSSQTVDVQLDEEGHGEVQFALSAECQVLAPPLVSTATPAPVTEPPPIETPREPGTAEIP